MIRGIGASDGVAIGRAYVKLEKEMKVVYRKVEHPEYELDRFNAAVEKCRIDLERRFNKTLNILGKEEAEIYKRHLNVFDGSILLGQVRKEIQEQKVNAEYILNEVKKKYAGMFDKVADEFLKKKSESIKYIAEQIIKGLLGIDSTGLGDIKSPVIIFAKELDSNDVVHLDKNSVLGIVTEFGGKASYSALISQNFEIPAIVGVKGILSQVNDGDEVIIDGQKGEIYINPDEGMKDFYFKKVNREKELEEVFLSFSDRKTVTQDGYKFEIASVAENNSDITVAKGSGSESIGLFKTEYLFLGREVMPSEDHQAEAYREAVILAEGSDIIFRTLDCSVDNGLPYIYFHEERNPIMGYRSIRVTLSEREVFLTQLKALLSASAYGKMKIVFPMITSVEELLDAKLVLEEAKMALEIEGVLYDSNIEIGLLIEVPVTAMLVDVFAREVDFLLIGSNDLMQFMMAIDRGNEQLFELYDMYHPGLLRMMKNIVMGAHKEGTWIGVVGDMANNELLVPFFVAIGVDQISMNAALVNKARWIASKTDKSMWEGHVSQLLDMTSGNEVKSHLEKCYYEAYIWS